MNWGKGIVLGMIVFVIFITAMGINMFLQPDDVDNEYYEKGLAFDADYNREKQVVTDKLQPTILFADNAMRLKFVKAVKCKISLIRPSDRRLDQTFISVSNKANEIDIATAALAKGPWQLALEWTGDNRKYLFKQEVMLP